MIELQVREGCETQNEAGSERTRMARTPETLHDCYLASSATTVLSSVTLHTYRGKFDWQNLVFVNMHEVGETNLLPTKSHVTIKYSSIIMTSYWDFLTQNKN